MRIIAAIEVDLDRSPIGTRSRLADDLRGEPVLRRTIGRLAGCREFDGLFVLCPPEQHDRATDLAAGLDVAVETHGAGAAAHQQLVQLSRKWALDAWRGGVAGTCCFDEHIHPGVLAALAEREKAEAVLSICPAGVLADASLADAMARHFRQHAQLMRLTFSQAPPGLAPAIFAVELLTQLRDKGLAPGFALAYRPQEPQPDMIAKDCCYRAPAEIIHTAGRFVADCDRGLARLTAAMEAIDGQLDRTTALDVCRWTRRHYDRHVDDLPREVEIELTTEDQLARSVLRPRGSVVGRRGPINLEMIDRLAAELARYDDSLVVLGGFGEPLLHPQFPEILRRLREAGVYGVAVRTNGVALDASAIDAICTHKVDVLSVLLDAATAEMYRRVHQADCFDQVCANIDAMIAARRQRAQPAPLIVPEMVKDVDTAGQMEQFFDHWITRVGWAVIDGYSDYASQLPDRCVVNMAPSRRVACRRIFTRCAVLADGTVSPCDHDFAGRHAVGSLTSGNLADLWQASAMQELRRNQLAGQYGQPFPLCPACRDWDRP
ncbi:MAG TPA: radical SAM protein [Phycisphaerae bacterium]|nr:radical SAM protein [Phycisphaerae bacterium]